MGRESEEVKRAFEVAKETGRGVVHDENGKPRFVISVPLEPLDLCDGQCRAFKQIQAESERRRILIEQLRSDLDRVSTNARIAAQRIGPKIASMMQAFAQEVEHVCKPAVERPVRCHAARDGECQWELCPQLRDGEPTKTGRHCPLDGEDERD